MSVKNRWSFPEDMHRSYAFLFQTIDSLRVQMSPDLWHLVFGAPAPRDRLQPWTETVYYTRRHLQRSETEALRGAQQRLEDLQRNEIGLDAHALHEVVRRQERAIDILQQTIAQNRVMAFRPPTRTTDRQSNSLFQVQSDSVYCSVHALNNLARCVIFAPPDMLSAIECTRTLDEHCASPEDVMLMALREGVFLLLVKLTGVGDADELDAECVFGELLERAGGMIIYQPSRFGMGHYVPLVRIRGEWMIFSMSDVVVRSSSAAEALHAYILYTNGIARTPHTSAREQRRAHATTELPFIGLLPIGLDCLWDGAPDKAPQQLALSIVVRSLLRRALSEWRLQSTAAGALFYDIWTPAPLPPAAINALHDSLACGASASVVTARFTGFELVNPASFLCSRYSVYCELNSAGETLAGALIHNNGDRVVEALRQLRSYILSVPAIDCLFMPRDAEDTGTHTPDDVGVELRGVYEEALMTNRRWLRLVALAIASNAVLQLIDENDRTGSLSIKLECTWTVTLLALCCYTHIDASSTPHNINELWTKIASEVAWLKLLPCTERVMPESIRRLYFGRPTGLADLCSFVSYDASLWLLRSVADLRPSAIDWRLVDALALAQADDNLMQTDRQARFVGALRKTLFCLPLAGADSCVVKSELFEQGCFETPRLAALNCAAADAFRRECELICGSGGAELAELAIDLLAFDTTAYARAASGDASRRPLDGDKLRFLERAALSGFYSMHCRSFGLIDSTPNDVDREPALNNAQRVAPPRTPGVWHTAQVHATAPRIQIAPLCKLATIAQSAFDRGEFRVY